MISAFIGSRILATSRDFWMMILKDDLCVCVGKVHSRLYSALQV